jgi:hypothetical protein
MIDVTTGPENEPEGNEPNEPVTDFDYVTGALAYAIVSDILLEDIEDLLTMAGTGPEFSAGVDATIWLHDVVDEYYERV